MQSIPPPLPLPTKSADERNLELLSIFHYVMGGITAFFACIPMLHVIIGASILLGGFNEAGTTPPPPVIGLLFALIGGALVISGWAVAILQIIAGAKLRRHQSRTFCLVVAIIECLMVPLGTILGVLTIVALSRDSTRTLFR